MVEIRSRSFLSNTTEERAKFLWIVCDSLRVLPPAMSSKRILRAALRHSAVTMLKASGVSDVLAREIVGHESAAVSRHYTHLTAGASAAGFRRS